MVIKVKVDDSGFKKLMATAYKKTGDLTVPLNIIADEWLKGNEVFYRFTSGPPALWKDLSLSTKKSKQSMFGYIYPVLFATGRLLASITHPRGQETIADVVGKQSLILGTRVPYGQYHQTRRPFIIWGAEQVSSGSNWETPTNERIERWKDILNSWITSQ